jgi:hypothetical protein
MKIQWLSFPSTVFAGLALAVTITCAADPPNWTGEYADKQFLKGQAVFQLSITQEGAATKVGFDAVYKDGRGCAPEAECPARITDKGTLQFKFEDSYHNAGTGTITRAGEDVIVSLKATRVADRRCIVFYRDNMRLKRVTKKS